MTTSIGLSLPEGLPGFREIRHADLVRGAGPVMSLRLDEGRLPVVVPWDVNPEFGYRFDLDDVADLGHARDWTIVCVLALPRKLRGIGTMNQYAPIVVNERTSVAAQVVNRVDGYSTRDPFEMGIGP